MNEGRILLFSRAGREGIRAKAPVISPPRPTTSRYFRRWHGLLFVPPGFPPSRSGPAGPCGSVRPPSGSSSLAPRSAGSIPTDLPISLMNALNDLLQFVACRDGQGSGCGNAPSFRRASSTRKRSLAFSAASRNNDLAHSRLSSSCFFSASVVGLAGVARILFISNTSPPARVMNDIRSSASGFGFIRIVEQSATATWTASV